MSDSRLRGSPLIVALDHPRASDALAFADRLGPGGCKVKIANTLYAEGGPRLVEELVRRGFDVFLDLKFHDIPHQVAGACRAAAGLGAWMINVHAAGGRAMLEAAADAVRSAPRPPLLIAVTVLTSLDDADLAELGIAGPTEAAVERLAALGRSAGLDGVVCSPMELAALRRRFPRPFVTVTPGIRLSGPTSDDDQKRVMTPAQAVAAGADYLVVGRPITTAEDPMAAVAMVAAEISASG